MKQTMTLVVSDNINTDTYTVTVPTAGQLLEIENMKVALSVYYREIADKQTILGNLALDIVDMQAYFTALCPQLLLDLKTPIHKMTLPDLLQLRKVFSEQFIPWWNEWVKLINHVPLMPEKDSETQKSNEESLQGKKEIHIDLA